MTTAARAKRGKSTDGKMSLGDHLRELRKRLFLAAIGIVVGAIIGWFVAPILWDAISQPVHEMARARHASINYPNITAAFDLQFQIAIFAGIILSSPMWLYQVFAFLVPGLNRREKIYTFSFFFTAVPLFLAGCAAGWFVLPHIVGLLTGFAPEGDSTLLVASDYFSFVMKLVVAIGVAFVLPVFVVLLNFIGIVSAAAIIKAWRVAIIVILLFTAVATPSADIISMFMLAVPLVILYFAAYGVAWIHDRRIARSSLNIETELAD